MVDPHSHGVPRAPWYSGTSQGSHQPFAYGAFTHYGGSFQSPSARLMISYSPRGAQPSPTTSRNPNQATPAGYHALSVWALPRSLAATDGITLVFSSWGY